MPKTTTEPTTTTMTSTPAPTTAPPPATPDALTPAMRELIALFDKELAEVRFPGVDSKLLAELGAQVDAETQRVEDLRAQLDTAHAGLVDFKNRLQRAAEQGLAYAKVYAAGDAELLAKLAEINLGGDTPRRRKLEVAAQADPGDGTIKLPPRRGRKPKNPPADEATGTE
jgi:hypothetical protein